MTDQFLNKFSSFLLAREGIPHSSPEWSLECASLIPVTFCYFTFDCRAERKFSFHQRKVNLTDSFYNTDNKILDSD